jgi:hypothetical protein
MGHPAPSARFPHPVISRHPICPASVRGSFLPRQSTAKEPTTVRRENSSEPSLIPDDLISPQMRVEQAVRGTGLFPSDLDDAPESRNVAWLDDHLEIPERFDGMA